VTLRDSQTAIVAALAAVALMIAAAGAFVVVLPQHSKASHLDSQIAAAQASLVAPIPVVPVAAAKVEATDLFRLREAMPDTDSMPGILMALSRIAEESPVTILSIKPGARVTLSGYWALPVVLTVDGNYDGITSFLAQLRRAVQAPNGDLAVTGRLFIPNQVQLQSGDGNSVTATVSLDAFVYGAPIVTATTPTTTTTTTTS
jgi:Tfp pilus assembly protein PilO